MARFGLILLALTLSFAMIMSIANPVQTNKPAYQAIELEGVSVAHNLGPWGLPAGVTLQVPYAIDDEGNIAVIGKRDDGTMVSFRLDLKESGK